jgi:hypothetical protein
LGRHLWATKHLIGRPYRHLSRRHYALSLPLRPIPSLCMLHTYCSRTVHWRFCWRCLPPFGRRLLRCLHPPRSLPGLGFVSPSFPRSPTPQVNPPGTLYRAAIAYRWSTMRLETCACSSMEYYNDNRSVFDHVPYADTSASVRGNAMRTWDRLITPCLPTCAAIDNHRVLHGRVRAACAVRQKLHSRFASPVCDAMTAHGVESRLDCFAPVHRFVPPSRTSFCFFIRKG